MNMRPIMKVGMLGLFCTGVALGTAPAQAQSKEELLKLVQEQAKMLETMQRRVERLENMTQAATETANEARETADKSAKSGGEKWKWGPSPSVSSADGKFKAHVRGRIFVDYGHVKDSSTVGSQDRSASEFRTARLGIEGDAWKDVKYKFEVDFADNEVDIKDAYVQYKGFKPLKITVGQFKETASLEEQTSSRHISLMERASVTDAFSISRRLGVKLSASGDIWTFDAAALGGSDLSSNKDDEGYALTARAAVFPKIGNGGRVHLGASIRHRGFSNDIDGMSVRYRQRPHSHVSGVRYVNTGHLDGASSDTLFGIEAAGICGPFWVEGEWMWINTDIDSGYTSFYNGESSLKFSGGYIGAGWFLTGESRGYKGGKFYRPKVNNPVFEGGAGAWALTARYDYLDLVDASAGIWGGEQKSFIVGVNWYLSRHTMVKLNYAHAKIEDAFDNASYVDTNGENKVNSFTARVQVDW